MKGIYKITNKINGHMYIGKSKNLKRRWGTHRYTLNKGISGCKRLQNAWIKYGSESFDFEILAQGEFSKEELCNLETIYIKLYGYYNILKVSIDNSQSIESRQKISEANSGPRHPAWDLYPQIKKYWADKSNGRGGNTQPGKTKIMANFNIPRGVTQLIINKLKSDQDIQILEGYNKQEVFEYWSNPDNAQQAKYKHPGYRAIASHFNISVHTAKQLIQEFNSSV